VTYDAPELPIIVEQYCYWRRRGLTHHEMMTACHCDYWAGMTGDDVIVALVQAWNGLERA